MINSPAIYEARLLLVDCSSLFVLFHLLCIFISAQTILWPGNSIRLYLVVISLRPSVFLSLTSVCLSGVDENNRGSTAMKYVIGLLSVAISSSRSLISSGTIGEWDEENTKDSHLSIHVCICMHVGIHLESFACTSTSGLVCVCVFAFLFVVTQNVLTF